MATYKRPDSKYWWYEFDFNGRTIRESSKVTNKKAANDIEAARRTELAKGEVGIKDKGPVPTVREFTEKDFLPYVDEKHKAKPNTVRYYHSGAAMFLPVLGTLPLDAITDEHAAQLAARFTHLSPSTVNCALRALRRMLNVAKSWGKVDGWADITLAKGERQRNRVLSDEEIKSYLAACAPDWKAVATIMLGTGMRPDEVFSLRWENLEPEDRAGVVSIVKGKTDAAKRKLPMVAAVYDALSARHKAQGEPKEGWVFPTSSECGHQTTGKTAHATALENSGVKAFEPYCLRHTAATRLAESGCDIFTLKTILGHSSVTITQRYVHPQAKAVRAAFGSHEVPTETAKTPHVFPHVSKKAVSRGTRRGAVSA
jgi:integrase